MAKTFIVTSDSMGHGDERLGHLLMKNFLHSLARNEIPPAMVAFANTGVRLTCEGSGSLDDLRMLQDKGVPIASCGTCLEELGLSDSLQVGGVGTMQESVAMLCGESDVVTIA